MEGKTAGTLVHISSLPSKHGIGDLLSAVKYVIPFLKKTHQKKWQILPVHPVGFSNSPYQGLSAFAGNELFISPEGLLERGLLGAGELEEVPRFSNQVVEFERVSQWKEGLYRRAFRNFMKQKPMEDYHAFLSRHAYWLEDYCLFMTIKGVERQRPWHEWPDNLKKRDRQALKAFAKLHREELEYRTFLQFEFFRQWQTVCHQFHEAKISIIGDMPIFVAHDSADVWANQGLYCLDPTGKPTVIAGVPPDYFSPTGQRWGNPHYQWKRMEQTGFEWWIKRTTHLLEMMEILRIDHFRGFESYWEIPAVEKTAVRGRWVKAPGEKLFQTLKKHLDDLPFIAEDLGVITTEVRELQKKFGLPGMKILQFSFDPNVNRRERPAHYEKHTYAYTGTHDNDTLAGWLSDQVFEKTEIMRTLSRYHRIDICDPMKTTCRKMIKLLLKTNAGNVIIPLQDYHCLGTEARMNHPGTVGGNNWRWRSQPTHYHDGGIVEWIGSAVRTSGRT